MNSGITKMKKKKESNMPSDRISAREGFIDVESNGFSAT